MNSYIAKNGLALGLPTLAIAGFLAAWLAHGAYSNYQSYDKPMPQPKGPTVNADRKLIVDIESIASSHLFGKPKVSTEQKSKVKAEPKPVAETKLNVSLLGLIGSDNEDVARALVKVDSGELEVVSVGDQLAETNAVVVRISGDEMIIRRAGVNESVKLTERNKRLSTASVNNEVTHNDDVFYDPLEPLEQPSLPELVSPPAPSNSSNESVQSGSTNQDSFDQEFHDEFFGAFADDLPNDYKQP